MTPARKFIASGIALMAIGLLSVGGFGCSLVGIRGHYEERPHTPVLQDGRFEIRDYAPTVVATTTVDADFKTAGNQGFRRLGGYIFGDNRGDASIAMTMPVERQSSQTIAMTTPVERDRTSDGRWTMTFFLPTEHAIDELPVPNDSNVEIRSIDGVTIATYRYTGIQRQADVERHGPKLLDWIEAHGYTPMSDPRLAGYDPPWTIPFLRRNEVLIDVQRQADS